jgi:3-oxoacyl-[acyl-carrier protein] reductase
MDLGLKGKKAFIAGSSRGLGFATALALAQEGSVVAINGRNQPRIIDACQKIEKETEAKAFPIEGDISDPKHGAEQIKEAASQLGGLDLLVTNSGGPASGKFDDLSDEDWQNAVDLVFLSHVRLIKAALPYLRKSNAASVLTITSYSVKQPIPNLILSNSVRSATIGLTKSLALELGAEGIRINSLLPGWTKTERVQEIMEYRAENNNSSIQDEIKKITTQIPLGRMATPDEIGRAGAFLLSPAASYITGQMLIVGGGIYRGMT